MRINDVEKKTTIKKSEIWTRIQKKIFPGACSISQRITVWELDDIELWMRFKIEFERTRKSAYEDTENEAEAWQKYYEKMKNRE